VFLPNVLLAAVEKLHHAILFGDIPEDFSAFSFLNSVPEGRG
jgi:hypothetical protein